MARAASGRFIVGKEKEGYAYTSSGQGFDAYVNSGGKNQFVTITTIDTTSGSYQDVDGIKNRLSKNFDDMYAGVARLGSSVTVTGSSGEVTVDSDPATRSYQIVLVLPEGTDDAYKAMVNEAISQLQAKYPDADLDVKVKEGYGSIPSGPSDSDDTKNE